MTLVDRPTFAARPTIYNGIRMRSRLEAEWAAILDRRGVDWEYEPVCFANESGQYLPDFLIWTPTKRMYLEVKPYIDVDLLEKWQSQMEIIWSSEPTATLAIACFEAGFVADPNSEWRSAGRQAGE